MALVFGKTAHLCATRILETSQLRLKLRGEKRVTIAFLYLTNEHEVSSAKALGYYH